LILCQGYPEEYHETVGDVQSHLEDEAERLHCKEHGEVEARNH